MKKYYYIVFVLISQFSFGQDTIIPPSLNFTGLDVNWVHLAEDPNFIGDFESSNVTKYSSGVTRGLRSNKDYVYIFNQSINHDGDFDGFDLYQLDVLTGGLLNSLNFDSYTQSGHYYIFGFGSNFILNENSELIILGYRSINNYVPSDPYSFPVFFFFGKPMKFNIDQKELVVLDTVVGVNENMDPGFRYNFISAISGDLIRDKSGNYIHISKDNIIEDNFAKNVVNLFRIDDSFSIDSSAYTKIVYDTEINTSLLQLTSPTGLKFLNDTTLAVLNYAKALPEVSLTPEKASLDIYTVNAYDQVTQKSSTDVTDLFYQRENIFIDFKIDTLGGSLVLTQLSEEQDQSLSNLETHSWIAGFDFEGELLYNIRDFGNDELEYDDIRPFHFQDNILYFFVNYSLPEQTGFDIFKYDLALDEAPVKIGSIDQEREGSFDLRSINTPIKLIDDAFLLPVFATNEYIENGQWQTGFYYYVSIKLNDLLTSNSDVSIDYKPEFFDIYPNPATDHIIVEFEEPFEGIIEVYSNQGTLLKKAKIHNTTSFSLDLEYLTSGTYIIKLKSVQGQIIHSKIIFKQ